MSRNGKPGEDSQYRCMLSPHERERTFIPVWKDGVSKWYVQVGSLGNCACDEDWFSESPQVIHSRTSGMYADAAKKRKSDFTVEGAKYESTEPPHRVMLVMSSPYSNVSDKPFLDMNVWECSADGNLKRGRRCAETAPGGLGARVFKGTVAEVFANMQHEFERMTCLEHVFMLAGIRTYNFFVCGYNVDGARALPHEGKFCALDYYSQSAEDRQMKNNRCDHWLIKDEVCPTECWKAKLFWTMTPQEWVSPQLSPSEDWETYSTGS